jgi:putative transposase
VRYDHVHLVVEASDKRALSSGVRSVSIRIARYVNDLVVRRGAFWADRWFGRELTSPRQVRNALVYVLANFRKHARVRLLAGVDPYSSGLWFDGWRGGFSRRAGRDPPLVGRAIPCASDADIPVSVPRRWLSASGWRRHGLVRLDETPGKP